MSPMRESHPSTPMEESMMKTFQVLTAMALMATGIGAVAEEIQPGLWRITLESRVAATPDWNPEPFRMGVVSNRCRPAA